MDNEYLLYGGRRRKVHFGSRGGVYIKLNGRRKYLDRTNFGLSDKESKDTHGITITDAYRIYGIESPAKFENSIDTDKIKALHNIFNKNETDEEYKKAFEALKAHIEERNNSPFSEKNEKVAYLINLYERKIGKFDLSRIDYLLKLNKKEIKDLKDLDDLTDLKDLDDEEKRILKIERNLNFLGSSLYYFPLENGQLFDEFKDELKKQGLDLDLEMENEKFRRMVEILKINRSGTGEKMFTK
jgi:hypothetical protein